MLTRKLLRLLGGHRPQMPQIALVPHQHNHNIRIRMIPQLLQPTRHILIRAVLADVVDEQGPHSAAVVGAGDGAVALLARRVPDLGLDGFGVDLDAAGCEFDADGGFAVEVEFVAGEAGEEVGFADAAVADQDDLEEVLGWWLVWLLMLVIVIADRQPYIVFVVGHAGDWCSVVEGVVDVFLGVTVELSQ